MRARLPWNSTDSDGSGRDWSDTLRERLGWLESPLATYYLILGTTVALVVIGLVMVLSASSITSYQRTGSAFSDFQNQAMFAVIGVVAAFVASRIPVRVYRRFAGLFFLVALLLQALVMVPGIGKEVLGNRNWIGFGSFTVQPSEIAKLAMIFIVAVVLTNRRSRLYDLRYSVLPTVVYVALLTLLIMAGKDLGTTMVVGMIYLGLLWTAGVKGRLFLGLGLAALVFLPIAVMTSGNRTSRIKSWMQGCADQTLDGCLQQVHGTYALADGGLWGLGPGGSREKWQWLPEAHNDFIFAIIGEELGLPGTLAILALYVVFAYACYRLIAQSDDMFVRVCTGGILTWVSFQAIVNIGSVIGALPIVGVPLPFVSSGGSALVMSLVAAGVLLSFARQDPRAREALAAKPRLVGRTLAVLPNRKAQS